MGIAQQRSADRPLSGAFLQPKLIVACARNRQRDTGAEFPRSDRTLPLFGAQLGLGVGYQFRPGPLYVAPIIGASIGSGMLPSGFSMYPLGELVGDGRPRPPSTST